MVEHDERVSHHQREVRHADRVGVRRSERLDGAHEVVCEHADRSARERRQPLHRSRPEALELSGRQRVWVPALAQRPAQHLARSDADERVTADAAVVG
jgi:hypothetical protein